MAEHEVRLSTKNLLIAGIDMDFDVKVDDRKLGTMKISRGGLDWVPVGKQSGIPIKWQEFADWAESGYDDE
ncbi:hypothetical protein [Nocardia sp. NPDC024068]|uniref:hypothetical protein n=1 Tax=Nocardia sp. NPDC024068 TaxID=3157197 RepID=UPI003407E27F